MATFITAWTLWERKEQTVQLSAHSYHLLISKIVATVVIILASKSHKKSMKFKGGGTTVLGIETICSIVK